MERCQPEDVHDKGTEKARELTAQEARAARLMTLDEVAAESGLDLQAIESPEALRALLDRYGERLERRQIAHFAALVEGLYGNAFARRSGLPVGPPRLSLAS